MVAKRRGRGSSANKLRVQSGPISLQALEPRMMFDGAGVVTAASTFESGIPGFASNLFGGADHAFISEAISSKSTAPETSDSAAIENVSNEIASDAPVATAPQPAGKPDNGLVASKFISGADTVSINDATSVQAVALDSNFATAIENVPHSSTGEVATAPTPDPASRTALAAAASKLIGGGDEVVIGNPISNTTVSPEANGLVANDVGLVEVLESADRPVPLERTLLEADRDIGGYGFLRGFDGAVESSPISVEFLVDTGSDTALNSFIFIDTAIVDYNTLVNEWQGRGTIVLIDSSRDGIDQIMAALAGQSNVDAIHIVSHGDTGMFWLGTTRVTGSAVTGELAGAFAAIGRHLSVSADILIYGCDTGSTVAGQQLLDALALTTGADIAASVDDTGYIMRGGDWTLENRLGVIQETSLIAKDWQGLLAPAIISVSSTTAVLRVYNSAGTLVSDSSGAGTGFIAGRSVGVTAGGYAVWSNAGTVGGQAVDLRAVIVSNTSGTAAADVINFDRPTTTSNDPAFLLTAAAGTGNASIQVRWELVLAGTNTPIAADISYTIADLDGTGTNPAVPTREFVVVATDTLSSFQSAGTSNIRFITTTPGSVTAYGTQNELAAPPQPISAARFNWLNTTNWTITYNTVRSGSLTGGFSHDGNSEFNFGTGGVTTSIPRIDLDANDSTGTGSAYRGTYVENGTGVRIVDTDTTISNPVGNVTRSTITLTNAQTGDQLLVNGSTAASGTLAGGISYTISGNVVSLTGSATAASYQAALQTITFRNTTERPSTVDRAITIGFANATFASNVATSTIRVIEVNDLPTAVNDTARTTAEDVAITNIDVLGNDIDVDDALTVISATALNGTVTINANGTLNYTPNANYNGADTITYTVSDGRGGTSTATVPITITAVNDAPTPVGSLPPRTNLDGATGINVATAGGFADIDGPTATYSATGLPAGLSINSATGVITGTIDRSASQGGVGGVYNIVVTRSDGSLSASQTFSWTVTNPPPVAVNDTLLTVNEDTAGTTVNVLANDSDPDGDPLTVVSASATNGTVVVNANGTITFTPNANYNGSATITYTISDGQGGTATATIPVTVVAINDAPVAVGSLPPQTNVDAAVITNVPTAQVFTDVDNATLSYSATGLPAGLTINATTGVISGTINRSASQTTGGVYSIVVTATDVGGLSTTQTFSWTVTNPGPTAVNDPLLTVNEDTPGTTINVLANDSDPDGDPLTIVSASATNGTVVINANGTITFTPNANYTGPAVITYTISDGQGGTATATIPVTVTAVNDAPTPVGSLPPRTNLDGATGINVATAGGFADIDGPTATYSATGLPAGLSINSATGVITGTIDRSASQGGVGGVYNIVVTRSDGSLSATQTFSWTVTNPPPVAVNDALLTVNEDTAGTTVNVLANDSDPDGDPLTIVSASATNGTVVINANGTITFTPNANYNGPAVITYTISDGQGGTATATIPVTVNAVNDAPTPVGSLPPQTNVDAQGAINVPTAQGFADIDGPTATYSATGLPAGLSINSATGVITGTIDRSASQGGAGGVYNVVVTRSDGTLSATQTFSWTVTNPPPVAVNDAATTNEDTPVLIPVLPNDSDLDGDPLTVIAAAASVGTATIVGNQIQYTPPANFNGTATITYTISDGEGGTATATITVTVNPVNDPPVATPVAPQNTADGATISVPVAGNFSDVDGDTLSFAATGLPPGLTIDPVTGVISGTIAANASQTNGGVYTATITVSDGNGGTVTQTITFNVSNPAPTAANDSASTAEDTAVTVSPLANDSDPDGDTLTITTAAAQNGTVTINPDGTVTYTPNPGFNGTDTITYTISDGNGGTSTATITVAVADINDTPITSGSIGNQTNLDRQNISLPFAGAFSDPDGDTLTYTAAGLPAGLTIDPATGVISGTIDNSASQLNGGVYSITVTASDGRGGTATQSFGWTVTNPAPGAVNDVATTNEDTPVQIAVLANDVDPDGDLLTVTQASAGHGTVVILPNGALQYTPNPNFNGTDTILYTIIDSEGGISTASVTVTVVAVNDGPTTVGLPNQNGDDGAAVSFSVASAFSDIDGDTLTFTATGLPPNLTIDPATGLVTGVLDPSTSQNGPYVVTITATDPSGAQVTTSFVYSVQNVPPVAVDDVAATPEDVPVTVAVLTNDSDPDGDPLTITSASANNGTVVVNPDGTLTFTPTPNFNGIATVSYTVSDGNGGIATATLTIDVGAVNDAPTALPIPDQFSTDGSFYSAGVAPFFSDIDGDTLTFTATGLPAGLSIDPATGIVSGTIDRNASQINGGVYEVTITASDGNGGTVSRTLTATITNPAPTASNNSVTTAEDTPIPAINVLGNDIDPDGDPLTVTAASAPNGTVTINADGTLNYVPNPNFNGTDVITYTISDGNGGTSTASVTVTVTPVNDAPVAVNDTVGTNEDQPVTIGVLGNDSDLDGDNLTVTTATSPNGTVAINPDGTITFTPAPNFNGPTTITYTISDGNGGTSTATVTVNVAPVNDAPVASTSTANTTEDTPVIVPVLANDTDVDGNPLTVTAATAPNGIVVILPDGTVQYTPNPNFNGTDTITYTISDGQGGFSTSTVTVMVGAANDAPTATPIVPQSANDADVVNLPVAGNFSDLDSDTLTYAATGLPAGLTIDPVTGVISGTIDRSASQLNNGIYSVTVTASDGNGGTVTTTFTFTVMNPGPTATNDAGSTNEDTPVTISVLANDSDPDGDPLTVISATAPNGTVVINPDGTITYTPNANFNGTDTITYTISDGQGGTSTAIVTIMVAPVNDAPVVDTPIPAQSGLDSAPVSFPVAGNFSDHDGDTLSFTATGLPPGLTISATGVISGTLTPGASQGGPNADGIYTISVTANDGNGGTVTTSFTYTVTNPAPTAANDSAITNEDTPVTIPVLANDSDPDGDPLTVTSATSPDGAVVINANGTITFTPNPNFNGSTTITYTISDGNGGASTATVSVTVNPVNDAPVGDTPIPAQSGLDSAPVSFPVAGNFSDLDGDTLSFTATGLPPGLTISATGVISGTLTPGASQGGPNGDGIYTISVTASDGNGGTVTTTFAYTVTNPAPTAANDSAITNEDTPVIIPVLANDSDPDGDPLTVTSATSPDGNVVINADGTITFTPAPNFNGTTTITYAISDGNGGTATATVSVTVNPVNDAPVVDTPIANQSGVDSGSVSIPVAGNFSDLDGDTLSFVATGLPAGLSIDPATGLITGTIDRAASQVNGGVYTVSITASDGNGGTVTTSFTYTVTNPAPVATNDSAITNEDTPVTIPVLANDSDPDGDQLTVTSATSPDGSVVINANGTITFTPNPNFNGSTTITYTISDGNGGASTATVSVTVNPVNDAPTNDAPLPAQTNLDSEVVSVATAANFSDLDGDTLTFSATGLPAGLSIDPATGLITGTINAAASQINGGFYSVIVTVSDGNGGTASSTFNWNVTNPPPVATNDIAATNEDTPVTISVLANDNDPDGDPLTVTSAISPNGTVIINADGTITFAPAANFNGLTTITYTTSDGNGGTSTATVAVNVVSVNDAPATPGLPNLFDIDSSIVSVPAGASFADVDGDTLTFSVTGLPAGLVMNPATGEITGQIANNASTIGGGIYTVTVTANDGNGGITSTTFTWTVSNTAPSAIDDSYTTDEDTPINMNVVFNDTDPDLDNLFLVSATSTNGTVVINADNTLTFTPNANFNGTATVTYLITDNNGGFSTATATIIIAPVNDAPAAGPVPDRANLDGSPVSLSVADFFSDIDGDTLAYDAIGLPAGLNIDQATGLITGTIAAGASQVNGGLYSVTITADDGNGGIVSTTFIWTVTNPAPTAVNDNASTNEDTPVTMDVLANDNDPDGDTLAVTAASASNGTVVINADGTITYTPNANFNGTDTITYTISDGNGGTSTATVTVNVGAVNDAPVAQPLPARANVDSSDLTGPNAIDVSGSFSDLDGDTLTFSAADLPPGLTIDPATGVISGTIDKAASQVNGGVYSVTITANDSNGGNVSTTFSWTVTNPPPVAVNDAIVTPEDTPVDIPVLANDSDPDGDPLTVTLASAGNGTVTIGAGGVLTYTPNPDFNGTDTITYTISDGNGGTSTATVTVTVTPANDAPVAAPIAPRNNVDNAVVSVPVAANFSDLDGDTLTFSAADLPPGLTIDPATGVISGTIDAAASQVNGGVYSVTVTANDGNGGTVSTTFSWTVTNPPPVATNDVVSTPEDTLVNIPVLVNDSDPDGDLLTVTLASAANGTVVIRPDGTIDYTPNANFNGTDTITYTISDGNGGTSTATVTVNVGAVNDAPVAQPLPARANVDSSDLTGPNAIDVSGSFSDLDGDTLTFSAADLPPGLTIDPATGVISGTIDKAASQVNGGVYSVTITANDSNGGTVSTTFSWTVTNPPPVATNDVASTPEEVLVNIPVLANDSDPDGDLLTVTFASAGNGTVVIRPDGTIDYTPNANFNGTDTITYTISDGNGGTSTATVTVTVGAVNDPPVAVNDATSTDEDTPVTIPVLANDSDLDGNPLTVTAATSPDGTVVINPDGTITFTPNPNFNGVATITYTISDGQGGTDTAIVEVIVRPVNDPPVAADDNAGTPEDTPVTIPVLANDTDVDGDPLTVTSATSPDGSITINADGTITFTPNPNFNGVATITYVISDGNGGTSTATVTLTVTPVNDVPVANPSSAVTNEDTPVILPVLANDTDADGDPLTVTAASAANGTVTILPDGTVLYTPNPNFNGVDTVTYTISDGNGGTSTSTVTITVNSVNDVPVAVNDNAVTPEDTPVTIPVLGNDTDADGDPLTVIAATSPNGTVVINADGTITFTPNPNFNGVATITYTISDGKGGTSTATVAVTVTPVNDPPVAVNDNARTPEDTPVTIPVLANDTDIDGNRLTVIAVTSPNGTVLINPDGTITFTPDPNFNGIATITYTISDGNGGTSTAIVTVTVVAVNDPPVARNDVYTMDEDTTARIPVLSNDFDPDRDPLTITAATSPNGRVIINADGTISFTPNPNFFGPATITYTITDGNGGFSTATVTVNVINVNELPIDGDERLTTIGGVENIIPVLANATDVDGDRLSVFSAIVDIGTVTINADGTLTFVAPFGYSGPATITYIVSDGRGGFDRSVVIIDVIEAAADINALLGSKAPGIPDGWRVESVRNQYAEFIDAPLIINDTVNEFRSLNGTPSLFGHRPLLTAINGLGWLQGTPEHRPDGNPIEETVNYLDRIRDIRFGYDRLFDPRWGDFLQQSLTGFSVRQLATDQDQLMVESVVRDRVIYMEIRDIGADADPRIVEYQLRTRDGAPLPEWITMDKRGLAIIERPVDAEEIRLVVKAIRADGKVFEIPVVVQGATGEIQIDTPLPSAKISAGETLSKTLAAATAAANDETATLAAAFSSQA